MKILRASIVFAMLVSMVGLSASPAQASCTPSDTGTAGADTILCNTANPPGTDVSGQDDDDTITLEIAAGSTASVGGDFLDGTNGFGNDVITNSVAVNDLYGDSLSGSGFGYDTIAVNGGGTVLNLYGDSASGSGFGFDVITVNDSGGVQTIYGDSGSGSGFGNDVITINNGGGAIHIYGDSETGSGFGHDTITNSRGGTNLIFGDSPYGSGHGDDTITHNTTASSPEIYGDSYTEGGYGDDTIVNNGSADVISGDSSSGSGHGDDFITNNGTVTGDISGDSIDDDGYGDDTIINNAVAGHIIGDSRTNNGYGDDVIINNGVMADISGDTFDGFGYGHDTIINNGIADQIAGDSNTASGAEGDDIIINNGAANAIYGDSFFGGGTGNDSIFLGGGSTTGLVLADGGDDTVVLGAGGVSYGTACGDISTTLVEHTPAVVTGVLDGGDEFAGDTIVFSILTPSQTDVDALEAYLGSLDGNASGTVNGEFYDWQDFEFYAVSGTIFTEGATRLHDDGVVLAFALDGGIAVCSGEAGLRAGFIDFAALNGGQTSFNAGNGWSITVANLGGTFEVRLFDPAGVEHFNDANKDGAADSRFTFSP